MKPIEPAFDEYNGEYAESTRYGPFGQVGGEFYGPFSEVSMLYGPFGHDPASYHPSEEHAERTDRVPVAR